MRFPGYGLLLALFICGCASAPIQQPRLTPRTRTISSPESAQTPSPSVYFVPKGLYLTGLSSGDWPEGSWVSLVPSEKWPSDIPKSSALTGRVAERLPHSARIEIAAAVPEMRSDDWIPVSGPTRVTKRLLIPQNTASAGQSVSASLDSPNLTGSEIYVSISSSGPANSRLAANMTAIAQAAPSPSAAATGAFQVLQGTVQTSDILVLLDAPSDPSFEITISVHPMDRETDQTVSAEIQKILSTQLPGMKFISLGRSSDNPGFSALSESLDGSCTDHLEIHLFNDNKHIRMLDQSIRVMSPEQAAYNLVLEDTEKDPHLIALSAVMQALEMIGYSATAAWLGEKEWRTLGTSSKRAALASALARSYHAMDRDDWALEIALELNAAANQLNGKERIKILVSALAAAAQAGRASEFSSAASEIRKNFNQLDAQWLRLCLSALLIQDSPDMDTFRTQIIQWLKNNQEWHLSDDMMVCANDDNNGEFCKNLKSQSKSSFSSLFFEHIPNIDLALKLDEIGAPWIAHHIWVSLAMTAKSPKDRVLLWKNAASYARRAQRHRVYLSMMAELVHSPEWTEILSDSDFSEAMTGWMALDWRTDMAELCLVRARKKNAGERMDLLSYAAALYQSIGDMPNFAIVQSLLSAAAESAGQPELADQYRAVAEKFGGSKIASREDQP